MPVAKVAAVPAMRRLRAIELLHQFGMYVVGGIIVGNPNDTSDDIEKNLAFARRYVDWPYIQHPTPYPGTPMTKDFERRSLIVSDRLGRVRRDDRGRSRSEHLSAEDIEFMRWRAERWMKLRHIPSVMRHYPWFVLRNGRRMLAHTFRGSSWRSAVGLEDSRTVFARYKAIRRAERQYVEPTQTDPLTAFDYSPNWHAANAPGE